MAISPPAIVVEAGALPADVSTIDALARLQLNARRIGQSILLRGAAADLLRLIDFAGLGEVLCVEPVGQPEEREDALGVEEEGQLLDPPT
jgi:hypothetical protein